MRAQNRSRCQAALARAAADRRAALAGELSKWWAVAREDKEDEERELLEAVQSSSGSKAFGVKLAVRNGQW